MPVTCPDGSVVTADEGIRRGTLVEALAALRTAFRDDGVGHRGNVVADLGRGRGAADDDLGAGRRAGPAPAGPGPHASLSRATTP